jgi:putative ABC transport system substrate-binding protein
VTPMSRCTPLLVSRRAFAATGCAALFVMLAGGSNAEQSRAPLIAWLSSNPASERLLSVFRKSLQGFGYDEEDSVRIEARSASSSADLRVVAQEMVAQGVGVIVANGRAAIRAAQDATAKIPIVMAPVDDPYEFVASLSRPEGNITGLALQQTEIDAKQIEFLKRISPDITNLAIIYFYGETYYFLDSTANKLGIQTNWLQIKELNDIEKTFAVIRTSEANGILIVNTDILGDMCDQIARYAVAHRLPIAGSWHGDGNTSLLISYAADDTEVQHRAAAYVDRLFTGTSPQELPIEQVTKFELGVSLVAARKLGISVPPSVLVRADYVVE